jgi:hypothetical protein
VQDKQLEQVVDSICGRGCRYVNQILSDDAARSECRELAGLGRSREQLVLKELATVMAVYDETGSCEL